MEAAARRALAQLHFVCQLQTFLEVLLSVTHALPPHGQASAIRPQRGNLQKHQEATAGSASSGLRCYGSTKVRPGDTATLGVTPAANELPVQL